MALNLSSLTAPCILPSALPRLPPLLRSGCTTAGRHRAISCVLTSPEAGTTVRRSADYQPTICDYQFLQAMQSDYTGEAYARRAEKLKKYTKDLLEDAKDDDTTLFELVDTLQRLGVGYHFQEEIKGALKHIHQQLESSNKTKVEDDDLHSLSLRFRLLRQYGYMVPQDVFNKFMDNSTSFKECLCDDLRGVLSLYEASHLCLEGETVLDEARAFTIRHLKESLKGNLDNNLRKKVEHALELPYHWRSPRLEALWFIDVYEKEENMNPKLLEFSKLDYNICQAGYQRDVKAASSWWKKVGLAEKLGFSRDRLPESFLFGLGIVFLPEHGHARELIAQPNQIITTIDDIYDVYGTMEELELFTDAVCRWDACAMEQLPLYMKRSFLALINIVNEWGYDTLKEQGWDVLPYYKKLWQDHIKAYLVEAKWFHAGYTPTLEEYLNNGMVSVGGPIVLAVSYFTMQQDISEEILEFLHTTPELIRLSSILLRLCDDLGTSSDEIARGDVPKSIQCYMHEANVSEEVAREHIKELINEAWKKMNKELIVASPFSQPFIDGALGLARIARTYYLHGDGFGAMRNETLQMFKSFVVEPIPLND